MEICYYWIDSFRDIIDKQGFNLGSQLLFNFDYHQKKLEIKENSQYVKGFFNLKDDGKITNLTAIVGKNGVGKSSFLYAVKGLLMDGGILATRNNNMSTYYKRILVIKIEDKYKIIFHNELISQNEDSINIQFEDDLNSKYQFEFISYGNEENVHSYKKNCLRVNGTEILDSTFCIYFSQTFDSNFYYDSTMNERKYFDISTKGLLNEIENKYESNNTFSTTEPNHHHLKDTRFNLGLLKEFYINETKKKINILNEDISKEIINNHICLPEKILLNLDYIIYRHDNFSFLEINDSHLLRTEKDNQNLNKIEKYIYSYIDNIIKSKNNKDHNTLLAQQTYLYRIIDSYFDDVDRFVFFHDKKTVLKDKLAVINENDLRDKTLIQLLEFFLNFTIDILSKIPKKDKFDREFNEEQFTYLTKSYIDFIRFFSDEFLKQSSILNFIEGNVEYKEINNGTHSNGIKDICLIEISLDSEGLKFLQKLIEKYESIDTTSDFIKFQWKGLSTGEDALFSLYSRFNDIKEQITGENVVILFDEVENSLHPEWQRKILNNVLEYLPYVLSKCKSIQIILASNVPFLIADIPTQNIVYLEKEMNNNGMEFTGKSRVIKNIDLDQTFAANIHNLLINNFFMESTIGEFSAKKIEEIIKILKNEQESRYSKGEIWRIIQTIGEPIIRNKLVSMYKSKFDNHVNEYDIYKAIEENGELKNISKENMNLLINVIQSQLNKGD